MIDEHLKTLAGLTVADWTRQKLVTNPSETMVRLAVEYDDEQTWSALFDDFLNSPLAGFVAGIAAGFWGGESDKPSDEVIGKLIAARNRLPNLSTLFIGDIVSEENEISWIVQTNLTPLLDAYPQLQHFGVRGGTSLEFVNLSHRHLKTLIVETGGLAAETVKQILNASLPSLEHLELWLGDENYGGNVTADDLAPLLSGNLFPNLKHLGLRDSEKADDIASAIANAPIVSRLHTLDLSLGNMTDAGGKALLDSPAIRALEKLDLHHHYMSSDVTVALGRMGADVSEQKEPDEYKGNFYYYVAVSE